MIDFYFSDKYLLSHLFDVLQLGRMKLRVMNIELIDISDLARIFKEQLFRVRVALIRIVELINVELLLDQLLKDFIPFELFIPVHSSVRAYIINDRFDYIIVSA